MHCLCLLLYYLILPNHKILALTTNLIFSALNLLVLTRLREHIGLFSHQLFFTDTYFSSSNKLLNVQKNYYCNSNPCIYLVNYGCDHFLDFLTSFLRGRRLAQYSSSRTALLRVSSSCSFLISSHIYKSVFFIICVCLPGRRSKR